MNKLLITLIFGILLLSFSSAYLGSYKQGECIPIVTNLNASAVNITVLTSPTPNAQILLSNVEMTKSGSAFNYSFCNTVKLGTYTYGYCDSSGNCYSNDFEITISGKPAPDGTVLTVFGILFLLLFCGLLYFGITSIGHFVALDHDLRDVAFNWGLFFGLFIFTSFARDYLNNILVNDLLNTSLWVAGFANFFIPILAFSISLIIGKHVRYKKADLSAGSSI